MKKMTLRADSRPIVYWYPRASSPWPKNLTMGMARLATMKPAELAAICRYVEMLLRSSGSEVMTALSDAYGTLFTV